MKNKIFLFGFIFILFISFTFADCTYLNDTNLLSYYSYDNDFTDQKSTWNGTNDGTSQTTGIISNAYQYTASEEDTIKYGDVNWFDDATNSLSISLWVYYDSFTQWGILVDKYTGANAGWSCGLNDNNEVHSFSIYDGSGWLSCKSNQTLSTGIWTHLVITYDGSELCNGVKFYYNSQLMTTITNGEASNTDNINNALEVYTGSRQDGLWLDGKLDELSIFNDVLILSEIQDLYNSANACNPLTTITGSSVILNNINLTQGNYTNNIYFGFDGSVTNTNDNNFNCTLYLNNTINDTLTMINISNEQTFFLDYCIEEFGYNINVICENNNASNSFVVNDVFLDCIVPSLIIDSEFVNNTNYYDDTTINLQVNISDTNLFAVELNGTDNFESFWNKQFYENLTISYFELNISNSTNKIGIGSNYSILVTAWDSHTGKELKYNMNIIDGYSMSYNGILVYSDKKLKTEKKKDKYLFFVDKKSTICYKTENEFIKIENTNYNSHYVDFKNMIWVDELNYNFEEIYINGKIKELCFYNDKDKEYKTQSLGDLNINSKEWFFNIVSAPSLDTELLTDINKTNYLLNDNIIKIERGVTMIWFWLLFTIAIFMPFIVPLAWKSSNTNKNDLISTGVMISSIIFILLVFLNVSANYFDLVSTVQTMFTIILLGFLVMYNLFIDF